MTVSCRIALICAVGFAVSLSQWALGQVILNEVMADNRTAVSHSTDYPDYVELYNASSSSLNLEGLSLTDNTNNPTKFRFPANTTIIAGGYLVVWCDANNNTPGLHTGFSFKANGEMAALYNTNGPVLIDLVVFGLQAPDLPIGRIPNGTGSWQLNRPTPDMANQVATLGSPLTLKFNEWLATNSAGVDEDWFELYNPANDAVALEGLVFTDTIPGIPANRAVPALSFIAGEGFIQFFADDLDESEDADHVDFRLSSNNGETLTLYHTDRASVIDRVTFGPQARDVSQGRLPDGGTNIVFFPTNFVTPAAANKFQPLTHIVINEVLTHTDPPLEDAIELHNPTSVPVDISHWWLSNSKDEPQKFRIPADTTIPPGEFKVFYEFAGQAGGFNPSGTGDVPSFTLNSARGDEVYLSTGNSTGSLTGLRRSVDFGAGENGVSFGRYLTSIGVDFVAMSQRTFGTDNPTTLSQFRTGTGLSNAYPKVGPIVINELMYHPPNFDMNDNNVDEFIELLNITGATVLLYDPQAVTNTWRLANGVEFVFPANKSLAGGSSLLVVNFDPATEGEQLTAFRNKYGVSMSVPIYGPYEGNLDNGGESIELYRPDTPQAPPHPDAGFVPYILVDKVKYSDAAPWPMEADGTGLSLQRRNSSHYGNEPVNWIGSPPSPGRTNNLVGPLRIESWARVGDNSFLLSFTAAAGATYSVQYRDSLLSGEWKKLARGDTGAQAATLRVEVVDNTASSSPTRYYRLVTPALPVSIESWERFGNGSFLLRFSAMAGVAYSVQYRNSLSAGSWLKLSGSDVSVAPTNRLVTITDSSAGASSARFYRILTPPE